MRVRYAETDQMGVVYHSNYLIWFEVGRVELIRQMGLDYKRMEEERAAGLRWWMCMCGIVLRRGMTMSWWCETRLLAARGAVIKFGYRILRVADGVLLCEGETVHVCVGKDMKKRSLAAEICGTFCGASHLIDGIASQIDNEVSG